MWYLVTWTGDGCYVAYGPYRTRLGATLSRPSVAVYHWLYAGRNPGSGSRPEAAADFDPMSMESTDPPPRWRLFRALAFRIRHPRY